MTVAINLFAGPGAGKSTTAAGVFRLLKLRGFNVELVTEYAKDLTWAGRHKTLNDQLYVFAKQHHRMTMCADQVDYIVTDSPLLLSRIYGPEDAMLDDVILSRFRAFRNVNFFIQRTKPYSSIGRTQTAEQALKIDTEVRKHLVDLGEPFVDVQGNERAAEVIANNF